MIKKILILLCIVSAGFVSQAQTLGFPSIDSLSRYNNRYINNSPVEAFANMRLNTLLHGIIWWIDTAMNRAVDSAVTVPGNGNGGNIRYNDTLFIFEVRKDTLWIPILLEAKNGLTKTGDSVELGGTLYRTTAIDQDGNGITFHNGLFAHGTGDYINQSDDFSYVGFGSTFYNHYLQADNGDSYVSMDFNVGATTNLNFGVNDATSDVLIDLRPNKIELQTAGDLRITELIDSAQSKSLFINPANGKVTYGDAPSGGGGPGSGGILSLGGQNGITILQDSIVELGGTLNQTTNIDAGTLYSLNILGNRSNVIFSSTNSGTSYAGKIENTNTSAAGALWVKTAGSSYSLLIDKSNSTLTNGVQSSLRIDRKSSGTPTTGFGQSIDMYLNTSTNTTNLANQLISSWTNATTGSHTSEFSIWGVNSSITNQLLTLAGSGQLKLNDYGDGTFLAGATYGLGVDVNGNVVEYEVGGSGGGDFVPFNRTLTINGTAYDLSENRSWTIDTFADPTTTTGDILFRNSSGDLDRLGIGTAGQTLTVSGGLPAWTTVAATTTWGGRYTSTSIAAGSLTLSSTPTPLYFFSGTSPQTWTLPLLSAVSTNQSIIIKNAGTAILTVQRQSSDDIITSSTVTSIALDPGESVMFALGTGAVAGWQVIFHSDAASGGGSGGGGTPEVNTLSETITTTSDQVLPAEAILQYILVRPATSLTAFKVGTAADDDKYVTPTPVTAGSDYVVFDVGAHIPSTSLTVRLSGITSSTEIKLVYKTLHE